MGDSPTSRNEQDLRARARQRIAEGRLPRAKALRTWGGLGSGLTCDLCGDPILSTEPEFELQFGMAPAASVRFHRQCHSAWESVRHEPVEHDQWTSVEKALPPTGVPVEVRLAMGDARTIILGAMTARDAGSGEWFWINLTTKAPLPSGWRPIEWRRGARTPGPELQHIESSIPKRA